MKTCFLQMFSEYEPPELLLEALSQAAIVAADLDPAARSASVAIHAEQYIPRRHLAIVEQDICALYGLNVFSLTATHPASELQKIEPEELMALFVSQNPISRGSLAGASWDWDGCSLTIRLKANGKQVLEESSEAVCRILR